MQSLTPDRFDDGVVKLLENVRALACALIEQHGEFFPFAGVLRADDQRVVEVSEIADQHPDPKDVLHELLAGLRAQSAKGEIKASVVCVHIAVGEAQQDAIEFIVDTLGAPRLSLLLGYRRDSSGAFVYEWLNGRDGESTRH